jgi:hypothetical protein
VSGGVSSCLLTCCSCLRVDEEAAQRLVCWERTPPSIGLEVLGGLCCDSRAAVRGNESEYKVGLHGWSWCAGSADASSIERKEIDERREY